MKSKAIVEATETELIDSDATNTTRSDGGITLQEAIRNLHEQIMELQTHDAVFKIKGIELELAVITEKSLKGKAGINWIVTAGGEKTATDGFHHRIRIQLELLEGVLNGGEIGQTR